MIRSVDFRTIAFEAPAYLWLLAIPLGLLMAWVWRLGIRRAETRRQTQRRTIPIRERFALVGDFPFWLSLIVATTCLVIALARPYGPASVLRRGGVDLVILQDGSASMYVRDVPADRWQRSMRFLRVVGDSMRWTGDRVALAVFARIATPQIRLTRDPNTFVFFLDHLDKRSPFRIEDDTTWDTNLELGIHWGLRLIEKDEEINGKSRNAQMFVMISDGEAWSGAIANSLKQATEREIPLFVVGVGTLSGGLLPVVTEPEGEDRSDEPRPSISRLARPALARIAAAGNGQYFELGREDDRDIANAIIDAGRRLAPPLGVTEQREPLYWPFVCAAGVFAALGLLFLRERAELWMQAAGAAIAMLTVSQLLR